MRSKGQENCSGKLNHLIPADIGSKCEHLRCVGMLIHLFSLYLACHSLSTWCYLQCKMNIQSLLMLKEMQGAKLGATMKFESYQQISQPTLTNLTQLGLHLPTLSSTNLKHLQPRNLGVALGLLPTTQCILVTTNPWRPIVTAKSSPTRMRRPLFASGEPFILC